MPYPQLSMVNPSKIGFKHKSHKSHKTSFVHTLFPIRRILLIDHDSRTYSHAQFTISEGTVD